MSGPTASAICNSPSSCTTQPYAPYSTFIDGFGNLCTRLVAPAGLLKLSNLLRIRDSGVHERRRPGGAKQAPVNELPDGVLGYLLGSRYCDTDALADEASVLFGRVEPGWPRVRAILDYTHNRIRFESGHARAGRTASQSNRERIGVCRDFAHLAIACAAA